MKYALIIFAFLPFAINAYSQNTKGFSVPKTTENNVTGKTYALIVGVAKYKNPAIPQLKYADRDAMAFKNYLVATGVDSNNITLLLNEKATVSEFWANIGFLIDVAKKGDKVFIYFSGHGDVENKTVVKDAYLLPYDAPKCVYPAGAIAVVLLKSWIAQLSASGIQAIFIADACRSGNLAGGREGMEAAAAMLKENWQDEIKILSCQPGELSLEGKQWGGGRGLFSYELIKGMEGAADKNKDGKVTLRELNLYMMDKVPDEANPLPQNPALYGNMETVISVVMPNMQQEGTTIDNTMLARVDVKGFEESLLAGLDDSIKYNYKMFKTALDREYYNQHHDMPAYQYYCRIPDNEKTHLLVALMKRDLCSEIMSDAQYSLDKILHNRPEDPHTFKRLGYSMKIIRNILGDKKLNDLGFLPKVYFFEAYGMLSQWRSSDTIAKRTLMLKMDTAINLAPNAAYLYYTRGNFLKNKFHNENAAIADYRKSIQLSPAFLFPYDGLQGFYEQKKQFDSVLYSVTKMLQLSSTNDDSAISLYSFACYYALMGNEQDAIKYLEMSIVHGWRYFSIIYDDSDLISIRSLPEFEVLMGKYFSWDLAGYYSLKNDKKNAIKYFEQGLVNELIDLHYSSSFQQYNLYKLIQQETDPNKQHQMIVLAFYNYIQIDGDLTNIHSMPEFKTIMKKYFPDIFDSRDEINIGMYDSACHYSLMNDKQSAIKYLTQALDHELNDPNYKSHYQIGDLYRLFQQNPALNNIRSMPEFKALTKKYFPNDYKE